MIEEINWTMDDGEFDVVSWYDKNGRLRKRMWEQSFTAYYDEENRHHRLDGPARQDLRWDFQEWYVHGERIDCKTQEEFERLMRLKAFW